MPFKLTDVEAALENLRTDEADVAWLDVHGAARGNLESNLRCRETRNLKPCCMPSSIWMLEESLREPYREFRRAKIREERAKLSRLR